MVHSRKHYVQVSLATVAAGAKLDTVIAVGVNATVANLGNEVAEGSTLKAVYLEFWLRSQEISPGSFIACLVKVPGTGAPFNTTQLAAIDLAENKKNILWFSQGLLNDANADAMVVMKGWYKIPKSKQRFGLGDALQFQVFAQGAIDLTICGFSTFKEYS